MRLAGRAVHIEQRDPSMGPRAKLDLVEYVSDAGGPAAYDVSVVTAFRDDERFVSQCADTPGYAAQFRHSHKLTKQYPHRVPGAKLVPLVVEDGGRWHASVPSLVRGLARAYVARTAGLDPSAVAFVVDRWAARLSAILLRGNAATIRCGGVFCWGPAPLRGCAAGSCLLHPGGGFCL